MSDDFEKYQVSFAHTVLAYLDERPNAQARRKYLTELVAVWRRDTSAVSVYQRLLEIERLMLERSGNAR